MGVGNSTQKNSQLYSVLKPLPWQKQHNLGHGELVRQQLTNLKGEQYCINLQNLQSQLPIYQFRKDNPQHIVAVHSVQEFKEQILCSGTETVKVVTQRIPFRLADLGNVGYAEGLYILQCVLKGAQLINNRYLFAFTSKNIDENKRYVRYTQSMICFTQSGHAKIWVNQDIAYNQPPSPSQAQLASLSLSPSNSIARPVLEQFNIQRRTANQLMQLIENRMSGNKFANYIQAKRMEQDQLIDFENCIDFILRMRAIEEGDSQPVDHIILPSMLISNMGYSSSMNSSQMTTSQYQNDQRSPNITGYFPTDNNRTYNVISQRLNQKRQQQKMDNTVVSNSSQSTVNLNRFAVPPRPPRKNSRSGSRQRPGSRNASQEKPIAKPNLIMNNIQQQNINQVSAQQQQNIPLTSVQQYTHQPLVQQYGHAPNPNIIMNYNPNPNYNPQITQNVIYNNSSNHINTNINPNSNTNQTINNIPQQINEKIHTPNLSTSPAIVSLQQQLEHQQQKVQQHQVQQHMQQRLQQQQYQQNSNANQIQPATYIDPRLPVPYMKVEDSFHLRSHPYHPNPLNLQIGPVKDIQPPAIQITAPNTVISESQPATVPQALKQKRSLKNIISQTNNPNSTTSNAHQLVVQSTLPPGVIPQPVYIHNVVPRLAGKESIQSNDIAAKPKSPFRDIVHNAINNKVEDISHNNSGYNHVPIQKYLNNTYGNIAADKFSNDPGVSPRRIQPSINSYGIIGNSPSNNTAPISINQQPRPTITFNSARPPVTIDPTVATQQNNTIPGSMNTKNITNIDNNVFHNPFDTSSSVNSHSNPYSHSNANSNANSRTLIQGDPTHNNSTPITNNNVHTDKFAVINNKISLALNANSPKPNNPPNSQANSGTNSNSNNTNINTINQINNQINNTTTNAINNINNIISNSNTNTINNNMSNLINMNMNRKMSGNAGVGTTTGIQGATNIGSYNFSSNGLSGADGHVPFTKKYSNSGNPLKHTPNPNYLNSNPNIYQSPKTSPYTFNSPLPNPTNPGNPSSTNSTSTLAYQPFAQQSNNISAPQPFHNVKIGNYTNTNGGVTNMGAIPSTPGNNNQHPNVHFNFTYNPSTNTHTNMHTNMNNYSTNPNPNLNINKYQVSFNNTANNVPSTNFSSSNAQNNIISNPTSTKNIDQRVLNAVNRQLLADKISSNKFTPINNIVSTNAISSNTGIVANSGNTVKQFNIPTPTKNASATAPSSTNNILSQLHQSSASDYSLEGSIQEF